MKRTVLGILLAAGTLFAAPAFAWGRGGGFHGGGYSHGGGYGYRGGGYGYGGYGARTHWGYRGGGGYYGHRRWVPGYRVTTPFCFAFPLDPRCVVEGYWAY